MATESGQKICLCMIVKNEAGVIARCLNSVRAVIDYWVVVDTGSSDGTQEAIRETFKDIQGELHDRSWRDFAANRTEALELARPHGDYSLVIDADDALELAPGYQLPPLEADAYMIDIHDTAVNYRRMQLFKNALAWCYRGVLHEFPACDGARDPGYLPVVMRRNHDGARRREPTTYQRDAALLETALASETDAFLRSRYMYYLGQSYRDCGEMEKAAAAFLERAEMGFWAQEIFVALYQAGRMREALGAPVDEVLAIYERATQSVPDRAEALHAASKLCRVAGRNREGFEFAKRGLEIIPPEGGLFVEQWIYDYGLLDEYAVNGYWAGEYQACLDASLKMLGCPSLPEDMRERVLANARFGAGHWPPKPAEPKLGRLGREGFIEQHRLRPARDLATRLEATPKVLLAILAKQKEPSLPLYLECIEALDYPKSAIFLHVRTNNNTDRTAEILRDWLARVGPLYAGVEFDDTDVSEPVENFGVHEWNAVRFRVLGRIRQESLRRTWAHDCAFYFVADVDNFILPWTLKELVALNLPIVAPFLRLTDPRAFYSNFHAETDPNGYFAESDQGMWLTLRWIRGIVELPVVHTTYLVRSDVIGHLAYQDGSERNEYVVFSESARRAGVPQYLDNRQIYGYLTFDAVPADDVREAIRQAGGWRERPKKTLIFCTSYASDAEAWGRRYRRWLRAIRGSGLAYDQILMVDDGSPVLPDWADVTRTSGDIAAVPAADILLYHFEDHLGRKDVFDFAGWYRSFEFAGRYAAAHRFEKVIHIESDTFLLSPRMVAFVNGAAEGWTALWCPRHGFPETAIQIIAGPAVARFARIGQTHPHETLVGREFELQLPFDAVVKDFIGDRYGEYLDAVPAEADYAVQVPTDRAEDFYWWLGRD